MASHLSLTEASRRANVSTTSVRRWIISGKLKASKTQNDEWGIDPDELHLFLIRQSGEHVPPTSHRQSGGRRTGATTVPPTVVPTVGGWDGYVEALKEAREALARERRINDELRTRMLTLEQERTQHIAEMRALLSKDFGAKDGVLSRWIRR